MDDIKFPTPTKRGYDLRVSAYSASHPQIKSTLVVSQFGGGWIFLPPGIMLTRPPDRVFPSIQSAVEAAKRELREDLSEWLEKKRREERENADASEKIDGYLRSLESDN